MTLDEAIIKELDKAGDCDTDEKKEHAQLAHWLQSYKDMNGQSSVVPNVTLYKVNRILYSQLPRLAITEEQKLNLYKFFVAHDNEYYMLMCKELSYFTCIKAGFGIKTRDTLVDLITSHIEGYLVDIEFREDGNVEIWMHTDEDNEAHMFLLFPYDWGVIKC